jgi:hypothetical protein
VQLLSTILLAVAAVTTAWCSYQAARWTAENRAASGQTNALRLDAARAQGLVEAEKEVDVLTFTQWVDAYSLRRTELADFYFKRFREEFKTGGGCVDSHATADEPERPAVTARDAVQARCGREGESSSSGSWWQTGRRGQQSTS